MNKEINEILEIESKVDTLKQEWVKQTREYLVGRYVTWTDWGDEQFSGLVTDAQWMNGLGCWLYVMTDGSTSVNSTSVDSLTSVSDAQLDDNLVKLVVNSNAIKVYREPWERVVNATRDLLIGATVEYQGKVGEIQDVLPNDGTVNIVFDESGYVNGVIPDRIISMPRNDEIRLNEDM